MAGRRVSGASKVRSSPYTGPQGAPVAFLGSRSGVGVGVGRAGGQARLCGPVGARVGCPDGEDVLLRDLQDWDAGGRFEEAAADYSIVSYTVQFQEYRFGLSVISRI